VAVPVMRVGEVSVRVRLRLVAVPVAVPCVRRNRLVVGVAMVLVVHGFMLVRQRFVRVLVLVPFGQMKPHAKCHQGAGNDQPNVH